MGTVCTFHYSQRECSYFDRDREGLLWVYILS